MRFRGRVVAIFFATSLILLSIYNILESLGISLLIFDISLVEIIALLSILSTGVFKPWKKHIYPLTAKGEIGKYFRPMMLVLGAHLLWYYATQMSIVNIFNLAGDTSYVSLGQHSGLALYEPVLLAIGAIAAGMISDNRGRKAAFSTAILLMGLLAIFGSTMYGTNTTTGAPQYTRFLYW